MSGFDEPDLAVAIAAARAGAAVLMSMYGGDLARSYKSDLDFATEADVAAERAVLDVIRRARPDDGFVGEELGDAAAPGADRVWLVDPLCGTLNFAATTPLFSVNVALQLQGVTTVAAVGAPTVDEVYWSDGSNFGIEGRASTSPAAANRLVDINIDGGSARTLVGPLLIADPAFRARFGPRVASTSLALAWVATGQRLAYVTDGEHESSVHFAAGLAVCQAAGCVVTDFQGRPVHTGPGIIAAADEATHAELLALVATHLTDGV